ncbi:cell division protein ZapE [Teredinibacter turnerae]|uniref:cell division protein ZapE n=1 Tax=Teredinibacter turnerae TaxID=2426 RepID=UPI0030CEDEB6
MSHLTPLEHYQRDLRDSQLIADAAQRQAVDALQDLYDRLVAVYPSTSWAPQSSWVRSWGKVRALVGATPAPVKGLYFWGGVGRGKTYLMDVFFDALPFDAKMRTHFHRFMRRVHEELKSLSGEKDPLEIVAARLAREAWVICFDEFFVIDITDAMILANLLDGLFKRGVVLVATSNIEPDGLYRDGLQRARFLPAIALLNNHTQVLNVDGGVDYRLRALTQAALYFQGSELEAKEHLNGCFQRLVPDMAMVQEDLGLEINGREIAAHKLGEDVAWFSFPSVCDGPRSQNDYIELAREFHAVIVEGVPQFTGQNDDQARRFIYLVDEFYDRHVKLILSSSYSMFELYVQGRLGFEFERTLSRLQEMQSEEYLAREHLA